MKNKQNYLLRSSFAFLFFVMLGYTVQFYPDTLVPFDSSIQNAVRGSLPESATSIFKAITFMGNVLTQVILVALFTSFFFLKKWKIEAIFMLINGVAAGLLIVGFKHLYQRVRPGVDHLVHAGGYSFPSGHAMGSFLIFGTLIIIIHDHVKTVSVRVTMEILLALLILMVGLSRIYLGVHFPSDVIAGYILAFGILNAAYPFYDKKRFEWRFHSKQN